MIYTRAQHKLEDNENIIRDIAHFQCTFTLKASKIHTFHNIIGALIELFAAQVNLMLRTKDNGGIVEVMASLKISHIHMHICYFSERRHDSGNIPGIFIVLLLYFMLLWHARNVVYNKINS